MKSLHCLTLCIRKVSHPTWVRGLKCGGGKAAVCRRGVAPHVGAWIEIPNICCPYWHPRSHPTWVRGLKSSSRATSIAMFRSHPTWVRGLKCRRRCCLPPLTDVAPHVGAWIEMLSETPSRKAAGVAPHVGAWIEILKVRVTNIILLSHPTWVRGLKSQKKATNYAKKDVAPHVGAWIEIFRAGDTVVQEHMVAPHVGAWIEMHKRRPTTQRQQSHPTWVRGLKSHIVYHKTKGRIVAPHVGAWIEIKWKPSLFLAASCRTPRGCVD